MMGISEEYAKGGLGLPRSAGRALQGVRVLELCQMVAGPYCTKLLADMGAEVIKIEPPDLGDEARRRGPFPKDLPHPERSGLFLYLNTNKLGITLKVEDPKGKRIFRELVQEVDILVEDNPPGYLEGMGMGYASLQEGNQRLILTSITPFGQTGPYRDFKAYHLNTFHAGSEGYLLPGHLGWLLYQDREPLKGAGLVGDYRCGLVAAVAALIALYYQRLSGRGQHIDLSKQEALMDLGRYELSKYPNWGFVETRATRAHPVGGIYQCKDGFVQLSPVEQHQWEGLVRLMGDPAWAKDERFKDRPSRAQNREEADTHISEWALRHTMEEIYHGAQAQGCPVGAIYSPGDLMRSEHLQARGYFVEVEHPDTGKVLYPGAPAKFSETPWGVDRSAPRLGEHNEEVYVKKLGYDRGRLAVLRQAGVI